MPERSVTVRIRSIFDRSGIDQFKQGMEQADTATENMGSKADDTATKTDTLGTALRGAFTIGLALKIGQVGVQMYNVGTEVNKTKERFEELVAPMGDAEEILARMREASLGVATDVELQTGANLLLQMGLADSPEELETMIGLITRLKSPTEELGDAINNFSLLLANQSLLRLDSFGISSARVRVRMEELREAGIALNREDAFKLATLEEAQRSVDRLGSAAENASTPVARLQTGLENLFNKGSGNLTAGVEGIAGIAEIALQQNPEQQRQAQAMAEQTLANLNSAMMNAMNEGHFGAGFSSDFVYNYMSTAFDLAQRNPELLNDVEEFSTAIFATMDQGLRSGPRGYLDLLAFSDDDPDGQKAIQAMTEIAIEVDAAAKATNALAAEEEAAAMAAEEAAIAEEAYKLRLEDTRESIQGVFDIMRDRTAQMEEQRGLMDELAGLEQSAITEGFRLFEGMAFDDTLPDFMTQEQAENIRAMADEAERLAEELEDAAKEAPGLISDAELENARNTADAVGDMADEAERAADAFENIKLSDIFGQTGGGTLGEISGAVIEQLQQQEAPEEVLDAARREFALASGQETASSLLFQEQVAPMIASIAQDVGPEAASAMAQVFDQVVREAALQGIDLNTERALEQVGTAFGEGFDPGDFNPDTFNVDTFLASIAGEEVTTAMENLSTSSDTIAVNLSAAAPASEIMSDATEATVEPMASVATNAGDTAINMETAATAASNLEKSMLALTSKVHKIKAQIDVTVTGDDINGLVETAVRNNGGKVPGAVDS